MWTGRTGRPWPSGPSSAGTCAPRGCPPRHPDRPGPLAPADARRAVPVALLVAGAPAGLPGRRPAARPAPPPGGHHRHAHPQRPAAQRRAAGPTAFYDDIAWLGLAVQRAGTLARRSGPSALGAITRQLHAGWTEDGGGGIWWRRGGGGRPGQERARERARRDPAGPRRPDRVRRGDHRLDGRDARRPRLRPRPRRRAAGPGRLGPRDRPPHLHLLPGRAPGRVRRAGRPRRAPALGRPRGGARRRRDPPPGPTPTACCPAAAAATAGCSRASSRATSADAALRRPELTDAAVPLVLASADAAWAGQAGERRRAGVLRRLGRPAPHPARGVPEADLSVQLCAWMLLEAAARLPALPERASAGGGLPARRARTSSTMIGSDRHGTPSG